MTQINLLPWREMARQAKKLRFAATIAAFIALSLFFVFLVHLYIEAFIISQEHTNTYLQSQLDKEQTTLTTLAKEKQEQAAIYSELHFLFALREDSYKAVGILDQLARVVPDAVSLSKISRAGNSLTIEGRAQSNLQVTLFMENIAKSHFFKQPVLTEISTKENSSGDERTFQLKVDLQDSA